jgi:5S rRNA maturation endonuclease (ribonuclease M5)
MAKIKEITGKVEPKLSTEDVHRLIIDEIGKIPGQKNFSASHALVCCPMPDHDDKTPSCGIYLEVGMSIPLGYFHCLGCGAKGHWNVLAKAAGLQEIPDWKLKDAALLSSSAVSSRMKKIADKVGRYDSIKQLMRALQRDSYVPWPEDIDWRGYSGTLIRACEGQLTQQSYTNQPVCFFPVKIGGKYIGGVAAYMKKMFKTSYLTSKGEWAKEKGLFPYALIRATLKKYKLRYVVIVEGPRDALALIASGIPALAVLGAEQFGDQKMMLLELMDLKCIYTMTDNDKGGKTLRRNIKETAKRRNVKVVHFKLPEEKDENGKLIKMDPDNAPKEIIKEVRAMLKAEQGGLIPAKKLGWVRV